MNYKIVIAALVVLMAITVPVLADDVCDTIVEINATNDGVVTHSYGWPAGAPFYTLRAQTGNWASNSASLKPYLASSPDSGYYSTLYRGALIFNTESIPEDVTFCNATLSLSAYSSGYQVSNLGVINYSITDYTPATAGTIGTYDFDNTANTPYSLDNLTITESARNNWSLNTAGLAAINTAGYTNMMLRSYWDIYNSTSNLTWADSKNTSARFYQIEQGGTTQPVLRIAYNSTAGEAGGFEGVTFTSNATEDMDPIAVVEFTDTSNVLAPISRLWEYIYVGTVYQGWNADGDYGPPYDTVPEYHAFNATNNESTLTYGWGNGNYSIRLSITNATTTYVSASNYSFVNVSSGISGNKSWDGSYEFYTPRNIFKVNISELEVHPKSDAWRTNLSEQLTSDYVYYSNGLNTAPAFVVNDSFAEQDVLISSRQTWTDNRFTTPIPDDFWYKDQGTDHVAQIFDFDTNTEYSLGSISHKYNGTWGARLTIHNWSNDLYRFYPNQFQGNYYIQDTDLALRNNTTQFWGPGMTGIPSYAFALRYDEVKSGTINHGFYITILYAGNASSAQWPAINTGDSGERINCPAPGSCWRIKPSVDLSTKGLGTDAMVAATAMKKYCSIIGENGASRFEIYTVNDTRWNTTDLATLHNIGLDDLEAVNITPLMLPDENSRYTMEANVVPETTFTKNRVVVARPALLVVNSSSVTSPALKTPTAWNWSWGDGTYSATKNATHRYTRPGIFTVTLTASNEYGTSTSSSTVISIGRSDQQFSPFKDRKLFVNVEDGTFTASRELSEQETDRVLCRIYEVC